MLLVPVIAALSGCASLGYYGQALQGHWEITSKKRAISTLLADPDTPEDLRVRLEQVRQIRAFAVESLGLPDSGSYTQYVDLERDVTLWLVTAAPKLSLEPRRWCYPLVGCFSYRGYFQRPRADRALERLAGQGYDVAVAPGLAYSTLGFSRDPVLNTMLAYDELALAGVIFHELAHEQYFLKGDTGFNESFATAVERLGKERWAAARGLTVDPAGQARMDRRDEEFTGMLLAARGHLETLYGSDSSESDKLAGKEAILGQLAVDFRTFRQRWDGFTGYDHWFDPGPPNNARLALLATYEKSVPAFLALFRQNDQSFPRFFEAVRRLGNQPEEQRDRAIQALLEAAAAP